MNDDLISRSWILEQLDGLGDTRLIKRNSVALVTNAPTVDAVPVVRCMDCKHHEDEGIGMVYCPNVIGSWVGENWFCADGERKEDVN